MPLPSGLLNRGVDHIKEAMDGLRIGKELIAKVQVQHLQFIEEIHTGQEAPPDRI